MVAARKRENQNRINYKIYLFFYGKGKLYNIIKSLFVLKDYGRDIPLAWPVVALSKCVVVVDRSILCVDEDVFDFGAAVDVDEKLDTLLAADLWTDDGDDDDDVFRLVNGSVVVSCSTAAMIAL